jgi:hypothetical protein
MRRSTAGRWICGWTASYQANRRNQADHESGDDGSYGFDIDAKQSELIALPYQLINDRGNSGRSDLTSIRENRHCRSDDER